VGGDPPRERFAKTMPQVPLLSAQTGAPLLDEGRTLPAMAQRSAAFIAPEGRGVSGGAEAAFIAPEPSEAPDERTGDTRTMPPIGRQRSIPGEDNRKTLIISSSQTPLYGDMGPRTEEPPVLPVSPEISFRSGLVRPGGSLEPGALIDGKYRVVRELGRGGMGIVYLAEDVALRRSVAVKVLLPRYARDMRHAERFRREARMLAAIEDENVVHIH